MEQPLIIQVQPGLELFRYDHLEPPYRWNNKHADNTEYGKISHEFGNKNQAGLFFLFDEKKVAKHLAKLENKPPYIQTENFNQEGFYLTKTTLKAPAKVIEFTSCRSFGQMIQIMDALNLNVLHEGFKIYGTNRNFSEFNIDGEERYKQTLTKSYQPLQEVAAFGQLLTDFGNGPLFKEEITKAGLHIDGYVWYENQDPRGATYCFFDSSVLDSPEHQFISFNDLEN